MRWWSLVALIMIACDSNPTPHPSRGDDVIGAEVGGVYDPDDMSDALNPAAEPDALDPSDKGDTNGLVGDVGDVDDANETDVSPDAGDVSGDASEPE